MGRLIPPGEVGSGSSPPPREDEDMSQGKESKGLRATFEQWQSAIDERIRAVLPNFAAFSDLQAEVKRLADRLDALEKRHKDGGSGGPE
jgi:hypothetical protein